MNQKGYTLIELLMVVAIISILVSGAIPSLLRARLSANEIGAVGGLKTLVAAQIDYNNNTLPHTYSPELSYLAEGRYAGEVAFIDPVLGEGLKSGYTFNLVPGNLQPDGAYLSYFITAWPVVYNSTGIRSFYVDETGVLRGQDIGGVQGTEALGSLD